MRTLLFTIFIIISTQIFSQKNQLIWAPIGAKWEYITGFLSGNSTCSISVEKDTIIQKRNCKKIRNTCSLPSYAENYFIYQKNQDTIEYLLNDTFRVLFDFSRKVGDTVKIRAHNPFGNGYDPCSSSSINRIASIDKYTLSNIVIRNYIFSGKSQDHFSCTMYSGNYVFEVFGPFSGYLFPMNSLDEIYHSLSRYSDSCWDIEPTLHWEINNITYSIKVNRSCLISATKETYIGSEILLYPNPAISQVNIKNSTGYKIDHLQIIDNLGRVFIDKAGNNNIVNINDIPPGFYFVRLNIKNVIITKRLLIVKER